MQRMLVGLIVFLTLVVGILGIVVYDLAQEVDSLSRARPTASQPRRTPGEGVDPSRLQSVEGRLGEMDREMARLRRDWEAARSAAERSARGGEPSADGNEGGARLPDLPPPEFGRPGEIQRDADGSFRITEEEEEYFMALQRRVERRRRVESSTRNLMRRIDRMAGTGTIQPIPAEGREDVRKVVRRFVAANDAMLSHYFRDPPDEVRAMAPEARAESVRREREAMATQAREALVPLLGEQDASAVTEKTFRNPWGRRLGGRRTGLRDRR